MASPNEQRWQNPKEIMKTHRIKKQSSLTKPSLARSKSLSGIGLKGTSTRSLPQRGASIPLTSSRSECSAVAPESMKRKNPFMRDASSVPPVAKRRSIFDLTPSAPSPRDDSNEVDIKDSRGEPNRLLSILKKAEEMAKHPSPQPWQTEIAHPTNRTPSTLADRNMHDQFTQQKGGTRVGNRTLESEEAATVTAAQSHPPTDWSLKTKMRVVVESREESFKKIPGIDAKNVASFVNHTLESGKDWQDVDIFQKLRRCCLHYSYPQTPWLRKFPRLSSDFRSKGMSLFSNNDEVLRAVQSDWTSVFTSLYQQLRGGICPYFYACTHQFTVLFRCQRFASDKASISALLTPSTRGFREILTKEDIEFRLPNIDMHKIDSTDADKKRKDVNSTDGSQTAPSVKEGRRAEDKTGNGEGAVQNDGDEEEDDDDDINDHHGASEWLEGMGLNKKDFPSLEPLKVKLQRDSFREIDNRPQSMVYVEGGDVHTFFNFLLNYPSCIASSGPQHGLPPTLLSPVPFVGGSLVQNNVKHSYLRDGPAKLHDGEGLGYSHVFEISGPVLPHHTLNIAAVLRDYHQHDEGGQGGSSSVILNTHIPSAALNCLAVNSAEKDRLAVNWHKLFVDFSLSTAGLATAVRDRLVCEPQLNSAAYVRELKVSSHGFKWS